MKDFFCFFRGFIVPILYAVNIMFLLIIFYLYTSYNKVILDQQREIEIIKSEVKWLKQVLTTG